MKTVNLFSLGRKAQAGEVLGTLYYKQLVKFETWRNPMDFKDTMVLDKAWAEQVKKNFDAKVIDQVPVPLTHTDDPDKNTGELIKLEVKEDGLYGYLDIRKADTRQSIEDGTIFNCSVCFDWNYQDTLKGEFHGPTLQHVALVNDPYLKGMSGFTKAEQGKLSEGWGEISTALAKGTSAGAIMLSESNLNELKQDIMELQKVKNDKEYKVTITVKTEDDEVEKVLEPGEEVEVPKEQAEAIEQVIADAVDPDEDKEDDKDDEDKDGEEDKDKDGEEDKNKELDETEKEELSRLRKEQAEAKIKSSYDALLSEGKITPAQEASFTEAMTALSAVPGGKVSLSRNGKEETVDLSEALTKVLQAGPKLVKFSEDGKASEDSQESDEGKKPSELLSEEQLKGLEATGVTPEQYDKMVEANPEMGIKPKKSEEE